MTTENKIYNFSLKTIAIVIFTTITIVGGSVFTIVKLSMDDKNSALEYSVSEKANIIEEQKYEITQLKKSNNLTYPIPSTPNYITQGNEDDEIIKLKEKVNQLENERNVILNELIKKSYDNLDPKSELSILINELSSDSLELRKKALEGLFILKDPKSINALLAYYFDNIDEALRFKYYPYWIELITELNKEAGQDLAIEMLKSDDDYMSLFAYRYFLEDIQTKDEMDEVIIKLNPIALNNPNTLTRTRAKTIISNFNRIIETNEKIPDNRSLFRVLLDIEKKIDNL